MGFIIVWRFVFWLIHRKGTHIFSSYPNRKALIHKTGRMTFAVMCEQRCGMSWWYGMSAWNLMHVPCVCKWIVHDYYVSQIIHDLRLPTALSKRQHSALSNYLFFWLSFHWLNDWETVYQLVYRFFENWWGTHHAPGTTQQSLHELTRRIR